MSPSEARELQVIQGGNQQVMLKSWEELMQRAEFFAKSALIPAALRNKPADVAIVLQMGWELGIPPMQALNGINVIQGKPSVSPELTTALIRSKVPNAYIKTVQNHEKGEVSVTMGRDRDRPEEYFTSTWTMARAQKLGLLGKDNYQKQPMTMLTWRATGEAARVVFPDIGKGLAYSEDENEDFGAPSVGETKAKDMAAALDQIDNKPAEKEVVAEVVDMEPAPQEPEVAPVIDPIADYVPKFAKWPKGKTLKDFKPEAHKTWIELYRKQVQSAEATKQRPDPAAVEYIARAEEYLKRFDQPEEPSFADWEPGSEG